MKMNLDDYLNLVTSEHKKPKFRAWLQEMLKKQTDISDFSEAVINAFLLNSAVGVQLDTLGEFVGIKRKLTFQPSDGSSPILDDEMYRKLIMAWIVRNNWNGENGTISEIWKDIYDSSQLSIIDNQDMTMTAIVTNLGTQPLLQELVQNGYIVPKPQCVRLKLIFRETMELQREMAVHSAIMDYARIVTRW